MRRGEVRWIESRMLILYDDNGKPTRRIGAQIDVTERRRSEDHKGLLVAELDHRVKNVLACVAAVAQHSREFSKSADEFFKVLNGRINAMANTHALLSRSRWQGVGLDELVRTELAFCAKEESALIEGPEVALAAEATQPVAMVLHELATNAAKYGALSNRSGKVGVFWTITRQNGSNKLGFKWRERGGPRVVVPTQHRFGTALVKATFPDARIDYAVEGINCEIDIQLGTEAAEGAEAKQSGTLPTSRPN